MLNRIQVAVVRLLPKNSFSRNVSMLVGGTAFAQGLVVLMLPILTRLYSPEDFSLLAVYMAILGLVTVASCLRFNLAIPIPEDDREAINLLVLSLFSTLFFSFLIFLIVFFYPDFVISMLGQSRMEPYLWMVPVGVFLASSYNAVQYWSSRKKKFSLVAKTRITQALGGTGFQLGSGFFAASPFGLIFGHMVYGGLGSIGLIRALYNDDKVILRSVSIKSLVENFRRYRQYPIYSVPESLFNTGSVQLPIIIIASSVAGPEAGFLMLAMRVMGMPMTLIGSSVSQVFLSDASKKLINGDLKEFTYQTIWNLFKVGGLPIIIVGGLSPWLFPWVFGYEWSRTGEIVAWATPWFVLQFITSPISSVLHVLGKFHWALLLQLWGLIFRVGIILIVVWFDKELLVEAFAISGFLFYFIYLFVVVKATHSIR